jgi:hypothetical protein
MNSWYYSHSAQTFGPVTKDQLVAMIQAGQLMSDHFIMREGADEWQAINASPFSGYLPPKATMEMPAHFAMPAAPAAAAPQATPAPQPNAKPAARPAGPPQARQATPRSQPAATPKAASKGAKTPRALVFGTLGVLVAALGWHFLGPKPPRQRSLVKRLEGEVLKVIKATGGDVEPQGMKQTNALWSGDAHLFWRGGAAGYSLDLEFNVEEDQGGKQRLKAAFTSSYDYGTIEVSLDGKKLKGSIYDLQAGEAVISGARDLGLHDLAAGPHVLRIGILDTSVINMDKRGAYNLGLDYLQLEPPVPNEAPATPGTDIASKAQPSASHCPAQDHVNVMNDGKTFAKDLSNDDDRRRHSWWPHFGSAEWAQYEWSSPQAIQECHVLWYSDRTDPSTPNGCGLPVFWRILYREESSGAWVPVDATIPAATRDEWNRVKFTPVKTTALRLCVQCPEPQSAGIYAWKVLAADPASVPDTKTREHPDLFLGDLSPLHAQVGYAPFRINKLIDYDEQNHGAIMVGRMPCSQFLWAHPGCRLDFAIPEGFTRFTAFGTGYSDVRTGEVLSHGQWKYRVLVDSKVTELSNPLSTYKSHEFPVDITFPAGSKVLTLITDNLGDDSFDHAYWAYPTFLTASSQKRPATPTATVKWPSNKSTAAVTPASSVPSTPRPTSSPPPVLPPSGPAVQIARFTFDSVSEPGKQIADAVQHDGIVELDGIYDPDKPAVTLKTPDLDYRRFTVAVRLQPDEFGNQPNNWAFTQDTLLVGGRSGRWFAVGVRPDGRLHFGIDGLGFANSRAILTPGEWVTLAVTCDQEARKAELFLNGESVAKLDIKPDAKLEVIGTHWEKSDKEWLFVHYGTGNTLKGAVDELAVYNGVLTAKEIAALKLGGENQQPPRIRAPLTRLAKLSLQRIPTLQLTNASLTEAVALLKAKALALDPQNKSLKIIVDAALDAEAKRITLDAADIPLAELLQRFAGPYKAWVQSTDDAFTLVPRR